jgi:hypothetical protein
MPWPPQEREWTGLLRPFPAVADRIGVRKAIEAAAQEYSGDEDRDRRVHEVFNKIARHADSLARSRSLNKLCADILQLRNFALDADAEAILRKVEPLQHISREADVRAAVYLSTTRRGRLLSRLSLAWTGPGKGNLPISATGAFADFMSEITDYILPKALEGAGVKKFVKREKARRDLLRVLHEKWGAQVKAAIDDSSVFLIDRSGQRKS